MIVLLQIVSRFWLWKHFENRLIFGEIIKRTKNGAIFWPTLYANKKTQNALDQCFADEALDISTTASAQLKQQEIW